MERKDVPRWLPIWLNGTFGAACSIFVWWLFVDGTNMRSPLVFVAGTIAALGPLVSTIWAYRDMRRLTGKSRFEVLRYLCWLDGGAPVVFRSSTYFHERQKWIHDEDGESAHG